MPDRRRQLLSAEALEFAPGLLSIQESPPRRMPRTMLYVVALLFVITLLWSFFGQLDIIASAQGRLVPRTYVKIVQPADAGIVEQILVNEHQHVRAGQVLMRMDPTSADADTASLKTQLALRSLQLRRITAELDGHDMNRTPSDTEDLYRQVDAQLHAHRQAYTASLSQVRDALHKAQGDYSAAQQVLLKLNEETPLLKREAGAYEAMGKKGYVAQVQVLDKERDYLETSRSLRAQRETVKGLAAAVAEAKRNIIAVVSKYHSDLHNEQVDAQEKYSTLQQELAKQMHTDSLLELRAPQAGIVEQLATHTVGTVVSPGTVLLSLVPDHEPLMAEVWIKNSDVGFVHPHQNVKVKLTAYPFEKYGMLNGQILYVNADATDAPASNTSSNNSASNASFDNSMQQASYKAMVALDSQSLNAQGEVLTLLPGMQVVAEVNEGKRSVMRYLLSPVEKTLDDSGKER